MAGYHRALSLPRTDFNHLLARAEEMSVPKDGLSPARSLRLLSFSVLLLAFTADRIPADVFVANRVIVEKSERRMALLRDAHVLAVYRIALGGDALGQKRREGDQKTPEGFYRLDWRNDKSMAFKSIHISYPDAGQIALAKQHGYDPGGMIMIHGQPNHFGWLGSVTQLFDWTDGCIAVTNAEMQEIWDIVPNNTPIEITP
jgi:murein L,D-transpeptidase YafK